MNTITTRLLICAIVHVILLLFRTSLLYHAAKGKYNPEIKHQNFDCPCAKPIQGLYLASIGWLVIPGKGRHMAGGTGARKDYLPTRHQLTLAPKRTAL